MTNLSVKNVYDLFQHTQWGEVEVHFLEHYGLYYDKSNKRIRKKRIKKIKSAYNEIKTIKPLESKWRLVITKFLHEGETCIDISGVDGSLYKDDEHYTESTQLEYANEEIVYGLSGTYWEIWLGMTFENDCLSNFTFSEAVAHCLWEMTFHALCRDDLN